MAMMHEREQRQGSGDFARDVNVGQQERLASLLGGGALALYGIRRGSLVGWVLALLGSVLAYRGFTGHCTVYRALDVDTATPPSGPIEGNLGIKIDTSIVVDVPPERLYRAWRNLANLPRFMSHLEWVRVIDDTRSRWKVKAPAGMTIEWDAEIINDRPNQLIAWRTLDHAAVSHAGSVNFDLVPGGTRVSVSLQYDPPGGRVGHAVASLFGRDPGQQLEQDLARFKKAAEAGEIAA